MDKLPIFTSHANYFMLTLSDVCIPVIGFVHKDIDGLFDIQIAGDSDTISAREEYFFTDLEEGMTGAGGILPPNRITEFHWIGENVLDLHSKEYENNESKRETQSG